MMITFALRLAAVTMVAAALCACSSSGSGSDSKKKSDSDTGPKYAQRSKISNWGDKHRSSFEKQAKDAEKTKSVRTGSFHTGSEYHAKNVAASQTTDKKYHGKEFAQSDKKDNNFEKSFSGSHETNRMGTESYKTSESHFGDKKSHENGREFNGGSQVFKTKQDVQAADAGEKSQAPKIIKNQKPGYTEAEVRAMLNKG